MREKAVTIAAAGLKRSRFMEILAFMRIRRTGTRIPGRNPQHSGNKKSFSHADRPAISKRDIAAPRTQGRRATPHHWPGTEGSTPKQ